MSDAWHLVKRFFGSLTAKPLSPDEQLEVDALLGPAERRLFWAQPMLDQRHAHQALRRLPDGASAEMRRAVVLHDVGKRHATASVVGRSIATLFGVVGIRPSRARWRAFLDHGPIGAAELERAGAEPLVHLFARHHGDGRPPEIDAHTWDVLTRADRG